MTTHHLARVAVVVMAGTLLDAQAPSFEVAAVKLNKSGESQSGPQIQPGRVTLINRTLRYLVQFAYSTLESPLNDLQVVGGPDWTDSERFDVLAKMESLPPGPAAANLGRMMMRSLLADRFRLKVRSDSREVPVYALVVARTDGRLGPGLRRRAEGECEQAVVRGSPPPDPNGPTPLCGFLAASVQGNLSYRGVPISALTRPGALTRDRIVVDRTKLSGIFDIDLAPAPPDVAGNPADVPFVFTAVQEQLGLKLEPAKALVEVIVIDHAEKPTPD